MNKGLFQFLKLAWPFILGWIFLALHFCAPQIADHKVILNINAFFVNLSVPISSVLMVRIVLTVLAGISFVYPAFRNYSDLFPKSFQIEVFFDDEGISQTMEQFDNNELAKFNMVENWKPEKKKYFELIESKLRNNEIPGPNDFKFIDPSHNVFSKGNTKFEIKKIAGFQKYKIEKVTGGVEHYCEKPGRATYRVSSEFELMDSPKNVISMKLQDIYLPSGWTYTLALEAKQIFRNSDGEYRWDHTLICVTKVRYFPVPSIGRTLYLYQPDNSDFTVPIGYCEVIYDE